MRLTDYITDMGRIIAFYPSLRKITGSTTSSLLLSQLLYWKDKTRDGWIYKTYDEFGEETGLSSSEVKTAVDNLESLNLIVKEYLRLDHTTRYKVNLDRINDMWDNLDENKARAYARDWEKKKAQEKETPVEAPVEVVPNPPVPHPVVQENFLKTDVYKKKKQEWIDGLEAMAPQAKKVTEMEKIKNEMERRLRMVAVEKWNEFIEFAYNRMVNSNQNPSKFFDWLLNQNEKFELKYWSPSRMIQMYPQAFDAPEETKPFITPTVKVEEKEEEYVEMPENLRRNHNIF